MDNFSIESDLSITGTKLSIDGKDITKKEKVVSISMYASSPTKDSEYDSGWVDLSVTTVDDNGNVETKTYRKSEYMANKQAMGQPMKDFIDSKGLDEVVRFIGRPADKVKEEIVDKMIQHAKDSKIPCPDKESLLNRTIDSLTDKATDMGVTLEDTTQE